MSVASPSTRATTAIRARNITTDRDGFSIGFSFQRMDVIVALAGFVLSDLWTSGDYLTASKAIYLPAGLLMTLPLAWRRRAPLPVAAVVMGALVFESLAVGSAPTQDAPLVGWLLAIYSVAA